MLSTRREALRCWNPGSPSRSSTLEPIEVGDILHKAVLEKQRDRLLPDVDVGSLATGVVLDTCGLLGRAAHLIGAVIGGLALGTM